MGAYNILALVLSLFFLLLPFLSEKKALMLYLIGSLIFPYLHLGDLAVRFELIYAIWLLFVLLAKMLVKPGPLRWHPVSSLYILYFMVAVTSTSLSLVQYDVSLIGSSIALYGLLRPLLVLFLFMNVRIDEQFVRSALWWFLFLSLGISALSVLQSLDIGLITKATEALYSSTFRTSIEKLTQAFGFLLRSVGVFESPVYNAVFILIVLLVAVNMLLQEQDARHRLILCLAIFLAAIAGITTISSTFLIGSIVILGIVVWDNFRYYKRIFRLALVSMSISLILFFITFTFVSQTEYLKGPLNYQLDRIVSGKVFKSRYSPEEGILRGTYKAIADRPLIGWGNVKQEGVFAGDSIYMATLYQRGVIGFLVFISIFCILIHRNSTNSSLPGIAGFINKLTLQITIIFLFVGIGAPSFHILRIQEWYWALVGMTLNSHLIKTGCTQRYVKSRSKSKDEGERL